MCESVCAPLIITVLLHPCSCDFCLLYPHTPLSAHTVVLMVRKMIAVIVNNKYAYLIWSINTVLVVITILQDNHPSIQFVGDAAEILRELSKISCHYVM